MKHAFLFIVLFCFASVARAQVSYSRYDVNNDHQVNVTDVTKLVNIILGTETGSRGDVTGDEAVNVNDVTALVDYILGKRVINGHEFVDLGLPSGTLWATQNMGASAPEQPGDYYAWGELEPKDEYTWGTYALCEGTNSTLLRYNGNASYGKVDNLTELALEDDAAHVNWGGLWRLPSKAQVQELRSSCTWTLDSARGGYVVKGPNGNTIFLPMSGYIRGTGTLLKGTSGYYWTSALGTSTPTNSYCMVVEQGFGQQNCIRYYGRSIRPVAQ